MATLVDADRVAVRAEFSKAESDARNEMPFTKPDLKAAVDAVDAWIDANAAAFNAALPQPFRNVATARQKALLMQYVVAKRYLKGV
jgi:hypothetical protein